MPHIPRTPESLLSRADSKNPLTTCRGLTSNGRPCRRALAAASSNPSSPLSTPSKTRSPPVPDHIVNGVITVAHTGDATHGVTAAFFCWQHRDQAASTLHVKKEDVVELHNRSSLDTLVERFGVLDVKDNELIQKVQKARTSRPKRDERPRPAYIDHEKTRQHAPRQYERNSHPAPRPSFWSMFCCFSPSTLDYDHDEPEDRPTQRPSSYTRQPEMTTKRPSYDYHSHAVTRPPPSASSWPPQRTKATPPSPQRAHPPPSPSLDFSNPASLISTHLPASTQTQLLAQLTKPLSTADEAGYIYVFQLDATTSPGASPTKPASPSSPDGSDKLLIKIGRTNNVHRRLSSWTRQCGHDLSLLRFYPYVSSSSPSPSTPTTASPTTPRTLPYSHRVERLIHIELGAQRVKQEKCGKCGKEHREWFEIEATRKGVRRMDEVVRRWVGWGEWMGERAGQ